MINPEPNQFNDPSLQAFYELNPKFDLTEFDFQNQKAIKKLKFDGLDQTAVLEKLKAYQRILKITPDFDTAQNLLGDSNQKPQSRASAKKLAAQAETAQPTALDSAHKITAVSEAQFVRTVAPQLDNDGANKAGQIYKNAAGIEAQAMHLYANATQLTSPYTMAMATNNVDADAVDYFKGMPNYEELFGPQNYCECDECKSIFGPAAYFVDLMRIAEKYATQPNSDIPDEMKLRGRRKDLFEIDLTCENTNQTMPYLKIVNQRLEATVIGNLGNPSNLYQTLAQMFFPFELPFHLPLEQIRIYLKRLNVKFSDIVEALGAIDKTVAMQTLNLSNEEWEMLTNKATGATTLGYFGVTDIKQVTNAADFGRQTGLNVRQIQDLLFQNLSDDEKTAGLSKQFFINQGLTDFLKINADGTLNVTNPALDRINRFLRLANKLGWNFAELDWALHCAGKGTPDINENTLIAVAKICKLMDKLGASIETVCGLLFDLKTYGEGDDETASDAPFDRVFNAAGLDANHPKDDTDGATSYSLNPTYTDGFQKWKIGASDAANQKSATRLASAVGLGQDDLLTLTNFVFNKLTTLSLTVGNISLLYRHVQMAAIVRLPIVQYVLLLQKLGVSPTALDTDNIAGIQDGSDRLRRAGVNVYELDYIVAGNISSFVSLPYREQDLDAWLATLPVLFGTSTEITVETDKAVQAKLIEQLASLLNSQAKQIILLLTLFKLDKIVSTFLDSKNKDDAKGIIRKLSRWLVLIKKLRLTLDEVVSIETDPAAYGFADVTNPTTTNVLDIAKFKDWQGIYGDANGDLAAYMTAADTDTARILADLTEQNKEQIAQLLEIFKDTNRIVRFDKVKKVLDLIQKTGESVNFLQNLKNLVDKDPDTKNWKTAKDNWNDFTVAADNLLGAVRAKLPADTWDTVYGQIEGAVQELKRTALIGTAISTLAKNPVTSWIQNPRNLYEYLLIDVEMSGCAQISYIKEGLNALQMYLLRCRQHLEPKVESFTVPTDWWQWLSNYRIWEANRKVFLYPENYIDPALRNTKTQLFKELENTLKQGDINQATVETAFRKYLDGFGELAKLKYVDAHFSHVSDSKRDDAPTLFLVARTDTQPYKYYYITWESVEEQNADQNADARSKGIWSEWQTIDVTINAEHVSLAYIFNRLFVFWVEQKTHDENTSNDSNAVKKASIKYSFINFSGVWVQPQTLLDNAVIHVEGTSLLSSANPKNILKILPENCFDVNQLWWKKSYPLKIEKSIYWVPGIGANKFEKAVIFYGPMIDLEANAAVDAHIQQVSSTKSVREFDEQLLKMAQNFNQTKKYGYNGYFPVFPPIVINNDLTVGYLSNPNEFLVLRKESPQSQPQIRPQIDRSAGELNLLPADEVIHDNYISDQLTTPKPIPSNNRNDNSGQTTISDAMRNNDFDLFMVKNHSKSFVFKGDKEAFLLLPLEQKEYSISRDLFNADTLFTKDSFISPAAGIDATGSLNIFTPLTATGTLDEYGRLDPSTDGQSLRDQLNNDILAGQDNKADKVAAVYDVLMKSPIFNNDDFVSTAVGIELSGSQNIYTMITAQGYLDRNGRLDAEIDFYDLMTYIRGQVLVGQDNLDAKVRFVVDTLYQRAYPTAIGFFEKRENGAGNSKFDAIRLTTAAVHKLSTSLFTGGVDAMLNLTSQQIPVEPELPFDRFQFAADKVLAPEAIDGTQVDFAGAYGNYYWELFFHAPFYIANLLKSNQQFEDAEKWYQYIFNPTQPKELLDEESFTTSTLGLRDSKRIYKTLTDQNIIVDGAVASTFSSATDLATMLEYLNNAKDVASVKNILLNHQLSREVARYWQFQPFRNQTLESLKDQLQSANEINAYNENPFDPHAIARLRIGAYEKAIVMQYVDNLLQWGDSQFAQYTWESLVTATTIYVYAYDLLGDRPQDLGACPTPKPMTFDAIYAKYKNDIPQFFIALEQSQLPTPLPMGFTPINALDTYFGVPENDNFIGYWDRVEDRLYKIRHCLNIQGVKQSLALFEPPIDPMQLVRAASAGGNVLSVLAQGTTGAPYYRFGYLLDKARNFANVLAQFGAALLAALEKKDGETLANLKSTQEKIILNLVTFTKENEIEEAKESIAALQKSKDSAQHRHDIYDKWDSDGWSAAEKVDIGLRFSALISQDVSILIHALALGGYLTPNIFGFADGGMSFGDAINMGAAVADGVAGTMNQAAGLISTRAQYDRRSDDWELQRDIAQYDIDQMDKQISSSQIQVQILQKELEIHQKSIEQADEYEDFLKRKFTNEDLYQWMIGQLSTLYFQTYQLTLSTAVAAQTVYQSELNRTDQFLQFDYWDSLHRGLLAGEGLTLTLNQIEKAYMDNNSRTLEIEKTISLLHLDPLAFLGFKTGAGGAKQGELSFNLGENLFDFDFPGHYCRKIKSISVTIPAVVGPYQNINATLTQTASTIIQKPDIEAVKQTLAIQPNSPSDGSLNQNWMPSQQIALSRGVDDSGLFVLDFNDVRYLPFEGTGAVSKWTLSLPPETNHFDFNSISDIIVKIRYTAVDGGATMNSSNVKFVDQVRSILRSDTPPYPYMPTKIIDLKQAFAAEWQRFVTAPPQNGVQQIGFPLTDSVILPNLKDLSVKSIAVVFRTPDGTQIADKDAKTNFVSLKIGDATKAISINNNSGVVDLTEDSIVGENCSLLFTLDNAPQISGLIVNKAISPDFLQGIIVIVTYQSNVFSKSK